MKVIYRYPDATYSTPLLEAGREYVVLQIYGDKSGISFRLMAADSKTPGIYPARLFDVTSSQIPSSWVIRVSEGKTFLDIAPADWTVSGFWENYFDNDPEALKTFTRESYRIVACED